jgi:hypothetical protein
MSDTATTETTGSESVIEKPDHERVLTEAFVAASNAAAADGSLSDEVRASVQEAYRSVPSAARGRVQGLALKAVLSEGNPAAVSAILDACNDLPKAPSSRKARAEENPVEAGAIRAAGYLVAYADACSDEEHGAAISEMAQAWYGGTQEMSDDVREAVLSVAAKALKVSSRRGGGSGTRRTFTQSLSDLVESGALAAGTKLTGPKDAKATVQKDGRLRVGNQNFDNPTAAAKACTEGSPSTNGWAFWQVEDAEGNKVDLGSLRTA